MPPKAAAAAPKKSGHASYQVGSFILEIFLLDWPLTFKFQDMITDAIVNVCEF